MDLRNQRVVDLQPVFGRLYDSSMPKLPPTGTKTVRLEFAKPFGFLQFVRSVSCGLSAQHCPHNSKVVSSNLTPATSFIV
jgi:hypothetical protein